MKSHFYFIFVVVFYFGLGLEAQDLRFQNKTVAIEDLIERQPLSSLVSADQDDVYIVQFHDTVTLSDFQELKRMGLEILNYFPDEAYLVRGMTSSILQHLQNKVRGVALFPSNSKLSVDLPTLSVFNGHQKFRVQVVLWSHQDSEKFIEQLPRAAELLDVEGRYLVINSNGGDLPNLASSSYVESIEPLVDLEVMYFNPGQQGVGFYNQSQPFELTGYETGTRLMGFQDLWSLGFKGQGQKVAVADTGLDRGQGHLSQDFTGALLSGVALGVGARNWHDPMGHGTHVTGSVASRGGFSQGQIQGGAPEALVLALGMWSPILNNLSIPPRLSRVFGPASEAGVKIHTNSWGAPSNLGAYNSMAVQADEWAWENLDFLVIFAAGNSGADKNKDGKIDEGSISSPGTAKNILTVGSSENLVSEGGIQRQIKELRPAQENWPVEPISSSYLSDNPNGIAAFSSRGPTRDQRLKPEVVAPGSNVLSSFSQEPGANTLWGAYDDYHVFSGGTSMSAPLVAAAAALTRQVLAQRAKLESPSASLVKALLMLGSQDLSPGQYGNGAYRELSARPDTHQGFGLVWLPKVQEIIEKGYFLEHQIVGSENEFVLPISLDQRESLEVLLVYTDAPGVANSSRALVNNLDLVVAGPGGTAFASRSQVNNFEYVTISASAPGLYQIRVEPQRLAVGHPSLGGQPFALVYLKH